MHMRTTLNIDDSLLKRAERLTGISEKTALIRRGLEALIALKSARRLAKLGGTERSLHSPPPLSGLMVLVDTSVWVDHLARGRTQLVELLHEGQV